jgi:simple sugar transport system ATP-binding protein
MAQAKPLLSMTHISKRFPAVVALDDVRFSLNTGEIHALLGENGAGKSTLIKVLTGVEHRDAGAMVMEGGEIDPKSPQEAQLCGISTVYQEVNLCPNLSVAENIYIGREPMKMGRIDWKTVSQNARALLARFDLDIDVAQTLDNYSVAVQQMVAIARAVDISAKVLILDEPTSSLSSIEVEKLFAIMRMLKSQGMGIVFVTHFLDQVYEVSDTITVLRNGLYVGTWPTAGLPRVQLVGKMIGKEYAEFEGEAVSAQGGEEKELYLRLEKAATSEMPPLSLDVRKGEVLGLSGLLGSGRTETANMIFGVEPLAGGEMRQDGKRVRFKAPLDAITSGIGYCSENRKTDGIVGELSIRENIILALQSKRGTGRAISRAEAGKITGEYIEKLAIKTPSGDQLIKNLSGGNQQKVLLARWLATNPDLLILDEPTRGIDIGTKAEIQKMVLELAGEGMSLIFISSEIDEMLRCCGRIAVLRDKEKVAELAGGEITEQAVMHYIAGGEQDEGSA